MKDHKDLAKEKQSQFSPPEPLFLQQYRKLKNHKKATSAFTHTCSFIKTMKLFKLFTEIDIFMAFQMQP